MKKREINILVLVDYNVDFTEPNGALFVDDADNDIKRLDQWLFGNHFNFDKIIVVLDHHPSDHCSFDINGGKWPSHCVIGTSGSLLNDKLQWLLSQKNVTQKIKGTDPLKEEYNGAINLLYDLKEEDCNSLMNIYLAGEALDICVKETYNEILEDIDYYENKFPIENTKVTIIKDFCSPIDPNFNTDNLNTIYSENIKFE